MNNVLRISFISLSIITLISCQSTQKNISSTDYNQQYEINELLKSMTATAIQNQDYEQARKGIFGLILNDEKSQWEFIQSAIFSLPRENALSLMELVINSASVSNSSEKLYHLSKVYISMKKQDLALDTVNNSIFLDENNLDARFWRARLLTVMKDYSKAEIDFSYIIKKSKNNQDYKEQYASFLQETEQFDKAQEILSELKPTPQNLFKSLVFALQNENNEKAKSVFEQLIIVEVEDDQLDHKNYLVAEGAFWLKDHELSKKYYRLVKGGDNYLNARQMLTQILYEEENYPEAIELLHQLQNAEIDYAVLAYLLESEIYKKQDDFDSLINTLDTSLELIPNNTDLLLARAMAYESKNKMKSAIKDFKQVINIAPNNAEAYNALGYSMADHDIELQEALTYIQKAIELDPENAAIIDSLGWAHYKLGNYQEAENQLLKALSKDLNDIEIYLHMHQTQLKLGKTDEALETIEQAKKAIPRKRKAN